MQKMTFEELERHELEKMKLNAFKACSELTSRINSARMLDRFMKSKISLPQSELLFKNEEYLEIFVKANPAKEL